MIQLYTGDGKGKTTASVGQAIRAAGRGFRVLFTQFMKGNDTGEIHILETLPQVRILRCNREYGFFHTLSEEDKVSLKAEHNRILDEILSALKNQECDMVVLDEITYPVDFGLLDEEKLKAVIRLSKENNRTELVLTGRNPGEYLTEAADYISEIRAVRHPFEKGIGSREGIEY